MPQLAESSASVSDTHQNRKKHKKGGKSSTSKADSKFVDELLNSELPQPETRIKKWVRRTVWLYSIYTVYLSLLPEFQPREMISFALWIPFAMISCYKGTSSMEDAALPIFVAAAASTARISEVVSMVMATEGPIGLLGGMVVMSQILEKPTKVYVPIIAGLFRMGISSRMDASMSRYEINLVAVALTATLTIYTGELWQIILISGIAALIPAAFYANKLAVMLRKRGRPDKEALHQLGVQSVASFLVSGLAVFTVLTVTGKGFAEIFVVAGQSGLLIPYWLLCLAVTYAVSYFSLDYLNVSFRRKIFHLCVVAMFLPTSHKEFTKEALAMAIVLFAFAELSRCSGNPLIAPRIQAVCKPFFDTRDQRGDLVLSHLSLITGVALPIFLGDGSPLGVIGIGLGDTVASIVGQLCHGKPIFGDKTHEGVAGFVTVTHLAIMVFGGDVYGMAVFISSVCAGYLEATTLLNDNLVIPAYTYAAATIANRYMQAAVDFALQRKLESQ